MPQVSPADGLDSDATAYVRVPPKAPCHNPDVKAYVRSLAAPKASSDLPVKASGPGGSGDGDATASVRKPAGPFLRPPGPAASSGPYTPRPPGHLPATPMFDRPRRRRAPLWLSRAMLVLGDIPIRVVYGVGAFVVTAVVVVLIFMLFSGDKPAEPVGAGPTRAAAPVRRPSSSPPAPAPVAVPAIPAAKAMTTFTGSGSPIASYVVDRTAGISYAQYGAPWAKTSRDPFSAAQKAGPARIGSGPVPVAVPEHPATYADYRALAAKVAKWSLRYQPAGSAFTWTVSQRARYNLGWLAGYKVSYLVDGKKRSSQVYVMVIGTSKKAPAMLVASVPDTRKSLYRDLNMLYWTARAI